MNCFIDYQSDGGIQTIEMVSGDDSMASNVNSKSFLSIAGLGIEITKKRWTSFREDSIST